VGGAISGFDGMCVTERMQNEALIRHIEAFVPCDGQKCKICLQSGKNIISPASFYFFGPSSKRIHLTSLLKVKWSWKLTLNTANTDTKSWIYGGEIQVVNCAIRRQVSALERPQT
jgi:hypothetical protein